MIQTNQGYMTFPDNLSTLHSFPSITHPPPDTLAYQPVRNHVSFAPRYQSNQRLRPPTYQSSRQPRPQSYQSSNRPRPRIDQISQQSLTPETSQAQNYIHQLPHHSNLQTPQHQFAVFQPGVPPTLSQLLTPRAPIPVSQARLHGPEDPYEDDQIEDFYLDETPSEDDTIDSDSIANISNTDASRPEERAPIPSDFSPI